MQMFIFVLNKRQVNDNIINFEEKLLIINKKKAKRIVNEKNYFYIIHTKFFYLL